MIAFFFLHLICLYIILTTMRQLNNKHYDTLGGFSAILANVSSHIKAPSVSLKDETMKQTIINNFIDKSVKMPSYAPAKLVMEKWGEWCISNPNGTYAEWKKYLDSLKAGGE